MEHWPRYKGGNINHSDTENYRCISADASNVLECKAFSNCSFYDFHNREPREKTDLQADSSLLILLIFKG